MLLEQFLGAIAFYTCFPLPKRWQLEFQGAAQFAPAVGLLIGASLGLLDIGLDQAGMPLLTRSTLIVITWVGITGGLHLDGVIDTGDGLAVPEPKRRLEVMADSQIGAFGAMCGIALLFLKIAALSDITERRELALMAAAGWGRWGQLIAIARYPYLKPVGKGAFHKAAIYSTRQAIPSLILVLSLSGVQLLVDSTAIPRAIAIAIGGSGFALLTGAWLNHQLGGHTGDTYGAVVEWTEALVLCLLTLF